MANAPTTLTLYNATGILSNIMEEQEEKTKCDICFKKMDGVTYIICGVERGSGNETHKGHTSCKDCVDNENYIGDWGRCKACIQVFGSRRSQKAKMGIALIPPVENKKTTDLVEMLRKAETNIEHLREEQEKARIQEGIDRRKAAVEDVQKRHEETIVEDATKELVNAATAEANAIRTHANEQIVTATSATLRVRKPMSEETKAKRKVAYENRKRKVEEIHKEHGEMKEQFDSFKHHSSMLHGILYNLKNSQNSDDFDNFVELMMKHGNRDDVMEFVNNVQGNASEV